MKFIKPYIQKLRGMWNKDINVIISDKYSKADFSLFAGEEVIVYPKDTKVGRILIDTGIAKSWAEVKASQWGKYEIPWGWTKIELDNLKIRPDGYWETRRNWHNFRPHNVHILRWEDKEEERV